MSLEPLEAVGTEIQASEFPAIERVRTLEYFEGELLSECRYQSQTYMRSWVSCDGSTHRWMVWRVDPDHVDRFLHMGMPFLHLIRSARDGYVFLQDVRREDGEVARVSRVLVDDIPARYLPKTSRARHLEWAQPGRGEVPEETP